MKAHIGVLTAGIRSQQVGGNVPPYYRIGLLGEKMGIPLVIVNLDEFGKIWTYAWSRHRHTYEYMPNLDVPLVLYNRIPTRHLERLQGIRKQIREWNNAGHIITNPHFLNKWELDQIWRKDQELQKFLPATELLLHHTQIKDWLENRAGFYLKPVAGTAGIGLLHFHQNRQGIHLREQKKGLIQDFGMISLRELNQLLEERKVYGKYLIQEDATLAKWGNRRFDVRMILHRTNDGEFQTSGMAVRSSHANDLTTHVPNGGTRDPLEKVLSEVFGQDSNKVRSNLVRVAEHAANEVARLPGIWCELSVDASTSPEGKPVLFEANAKPMKFDERDIETDRKRILLTELLNLSTKVEKGREIC